MKRPFLLFLSIFFLTISAQAAPVPDGTLLTIVPGVVTGASEGDLFSGSAFAMGDGIGNPNPGQQIDGWTAMRPGTDGGIIIGSTQPRGAVDNAWVFFNVKGWHYTTAPVYADCDTDALDFQGWTVFWNGGNIPMGSLTGYSITCSGSTYEINGVHVVSHPTDPNYLFNDVVYTLHLEGKFVDICLNDADCDDGLICNGLETCGLATGRCQPGQPLICDDADLCTDDACGPSGCIYVPLECPPGEQCNPYTGLCDLICISNADCDDQSVCNGLETCDTVAGACVPGTQLNCDDGNICTNDSCDPISGCANFPNTSYCNDGDACTVSDTCSGGVCRGMEPNCDDGNICTDDSYTCNPAQGCAHFPNTLACDDGKACTENDICSRGFCLGSAIVCPDGQGCVNGVCSIINSLPAGTLLTLAPGLVTGQGEGDLVSGSAFATGDGIGNPDLRQQIDLWTAMLPGTDGGILVGSTQPSGAIDHVWLFFSAKGWHYTTSMVDADSLSGFLDFSGWTVFWNGGNIPMGSTTDYTFTTNGDSTYDIDGVHVVSHPTDPNFLFNYLVYTLHLEGDIIPPCDGVYTATIRGGGQRPTTTDRQVMVEFASSSGGCIVDSGTKSVSVTPGTSLVIDWTVGDGPPPSTVTLDGVVICDPMTDFCPDTYPLTVQGTHKLILDNKAFGGKDTDRITIDVVP